MSSGLIIHGGALGDFVLALRVMAAMRAGGLNRIVVLGRPGIATLAIGRAGVDEVWDIDVGGYHALFADGGEIPSAIRDRFAPIRCVVNMLSGRACARRLAQLGVGRIIEIDPRPRDADRRHITDQWLAELAALGWCTTVGPPEIRLTASERANGRIALLERVDAISGAERRSANSRPADHPSIRTSDQQSAGRVAIVHPGAGSRTKCWPLPKFLEVADRLLRENWRVLFLLGPVEREWMPESDINALTGRFPVIDNVSIVECAALLSACGLYMGNDSGVSHLAAAVGASGVAVFGPTDPALWSPLGGRIHAVSPPPKIEWPSVESVWSAAQSTRGPAPCHPPAEPI